jgi:septum site-determining protein MinD
MMSGAIFCAQKRICELPKMRNRWRKRNFGYSDEKKSKKPCFPLAFCAIYLYNEFILWARRRLRMGELIAVLSGKGGAGKTSLCAGVATALAAAGESVLCIDCDVGLRNLDLALGMADFGGISFLDVCRGDYDLSQASAHPVYGNLRFLTAPVNCAAEDVDRLAFSAMLRQARGMFQYIFLDAPAGIDAGFRLCAAYADRVILVTNGDRAAIRDAARAGQMLELMGKPDVRLVVNRVSKKLFQTMNITVDDVMDEAGLPLLGIIPEDPNVTLAAAFQEPLLRYKKRGAAATACRRIAKRMIGQPVPISIR